MLITDCVVMDFIKIDIFMKFQISVGLAFIPRFSSLNFQVCYSY